MFDADEIYNRNSIAISTGLRSVVQDSYDNEKVFEIASLNVY